MATTVGFMSSQAVQQQIDDDDYCIVEADVDAEVVAPAASGHPYSHSQQP
jgi:hypothetical protein